ncbi:MAG: hypothetical protein R6V03_10050 [Kiritimatiellia bacterium]
MKIAVAVEEGQVAPCFPGVRLSIAGTVLAETGHAVLDTGHWHPLSWGRELARRDVGVVLCGGIDHVMAGALRGYGVQVVPNLSGDAGRVVEMWKGGNLSVPREWPAPPMYMGGGMRRRGGRKRRFRGGRG